MCTDLNKEICGGVVATIYSPPRVILRCRDEPLKLTLRQRTICLHIYSPDGTAAAVCHGIGVGSKFQLVRVTLTLDLSVRNGVRCTRKGEYFYQV